MSEVDFSDNDRPCVGTDGLSSIKYVHVELGFTKVYRYQ